MDAQKFSDPCQTALAEALRPALFKALSDPVRVSIVATLAARTEPASVTDLTEGRAVDYSVVSRHLKILREAGVVSAEKQGREVFYRLEINALAEGLRGMAEALEACRTGAGMD